MATPNVTVLVANYNGRPLLGRAIASALAQTIEREAFEILVADDGSTDESLASLKAHGAAIRVLALPHRGLPATCNAGIHAARGRFLIRLDADDELEPTALEDLAAALDAHPDAVFVTADRTDIELATGRADVVRVDAGNMYDLIAPGVMFRTSAVAAVGMYDSLYWEEYDLFLRLLLTGRSCHLPKPLYRYYRHGRSMTANAESRRSGWDELIAKWGIERLRLFGRSTELEDVIASQWKKAPLA